jgi:hypothetical protein
VYLWLCKECIGLHWSERLESLRPQVTLSLSFESDSIATTLLADVDVAKAALQDVFPVSRVAHFTPKAPSRLTPVNALKSSRMFTLVIVLQLGEYLVETFEPLLKRDIRRCVPLHNLFCALFDAI